MYQNNRSLGCPPQALKISLKSNLSETAKSQNDLNWKAQRKSYKSRFSGSRVAPASWGRPKMRFWNLPCYGRVSKLAYISPYTLPKLVPASALAPSPPAVSGFIGSTILSFFVRVSSGFTPLSRSQIGTAHPLKNETTTKFLRRQLTPPAPPKNWDSRKQDEFMQFLGGSGGRYLAHMHTWLAIHG